MKKVKENKSSIGNILITKELFIETMNMIEKQMEHDHKCNNAFSIILPNDYTSGYDSHWIFNQLLKLIKLAFNDDNKDSWIDYYIWDLEFGVKYREGSCTNADGSIIDLSNTENLYEFLIKK